MTLLALREQRDGLVKAMKALHETAENDNRPFTDDEQTAFDQHEKDLQALDVRIERARTLQEAERSAPAVAVVGEEGTATVAAAPKDDTPPEPFENLGQQLQAIARSRAGLPTDDRLIQLQQYAAAQGSVGVPSEGGFVLQPTFGQRIWNRAFETAVAISRCNPQPIGPGSNSFSRPVLKEESRKTSGSRSGGARVYWEKEFGQPALSALDWDNQRLDLEKLMGLAKVSDELMEDDVAMSAWYERVFGDEVAFKGDEGVWEGDGAGKPLGVRSSAAMVTVTTSTTAANVIEAGDVTKMFARMPAASIATAVWMVHPFMIQYLPLMTVGTQPVYMPPMGLAEAPFGTLMGRPVIPFEHCEEPATSGDIAFVDWATFDLISKGGVRTDWSMHVYFQQDAMAFRIVVRLNGQPRWKTSLELKKGSGKISPYVQLATRS